MAQKKKDKDEAAKPEKIDPQEAALELALSVLDKELGKGIIQMAEGPALKDVLYFPSGCPSLNKALSGSYHNGYARGRVIEVFGPESSGKTTLALHAAAEIQKLGERAAFVDVEHALDISYAKALGIDANKLLISQPDCGEDALNVVLQLAKSGALSLMVVDSVAALTPRAELEGDIGDTHVGRQARLMSQAMRMLHGVCYKTKTSIMFINQIRMKIGVMFGSPETTTGGNALKFYSSQRLDIRRIGGVKGNDKNEISGEKEYVANATRVKVVKNKVSPPFKETEFEIEYGKGINVMKDLLKIGVAKDIIEKSGAWYSYGTDRLGQGEANTVETLRNTPELVKKIKAAL